MSNSAPGSKGVTTPPTDSRSAETNYTLTDAEKRGLRAAIGHSSAACEIDGLPCVTCEATYREAERLLTELRQRVRLVLDGRMSGHHDGCHSWRRGFMCDCWRADLRAALDIETEEEAERAFLLSEGRSEG